MMNRWDERYHESKYIYGTEPNVFFKSQLDLLQPGRILLPGDGEGRNSVYAAKKNWKVDAFDYSGNAVLNAKEFVRKSAVEVNVYQKSILDHENVNEQYDAIGVLYLHLHETERELAHQFLKSSLKSGGHIIMEVFSRNQFGRDSGGPRQIELLYNLHELEKDFAEFDMIQLEEIEAILSEGELHQGKAIVIRMHAIKK